MAVLWMVVQNQFYNVAPGSPKGLGIGMNFHPIADRKGAGGHIIFHSLYFDDADPAGPFDRQFGMIAQPGDMKAQFVGRLHNRLVRLDLIALPVNRNRNQFAHICPYALAIALNLQAS